jgi:hypothetical protein
MGKNLDPLHLLLVALLAGGAWYLPRGASSSAPHEGDGASPTSRSIQAPKGDEPRRDDSRDAPALLAEYLNVDISPAGLRRQAFASVAVLRDGKDSETRTQAAEYLASLLELNIAPRAPYLDRARKAIARIRLDPDRVSRSDLDAIGHFLEAYFDQRPLTLEGAPYTAKVIAADFERIDKEPLVLRALRSPTGRDTLAIRVLMATLPDPIDSHVGWTFDPALEAIESGVAASGYVLDRFFIPDWDPSAPSEQGIAKQHLHERWPGLVLFRSAADKSELLMVFLVFETPTAGVHQAAFVSALRQMVQMTQLGRRKETVLPILGPTFSGSSDSIRRALQQLGRGRLECPSVRFF